MTSNATIRTSVRVNRQLDRMARDLPSQLLADHLERGTCDRLARRGITNQNAPYPVNMSSDGAVTR